MNTAVEDGTAYMVFLFDRRTGELIRDSGEVIY